MIFTSPAQAVAKARAILQEQRSSVTMSYTEYPSYIKQVCTRQGLQISMDYASTPEAQMQARRILNLITQDEKDYPPAAPPRRGVASGWHEVESTSLNAVKWDPEHQSLTVEFRSTRGRYRYDRVTEDVVRELLDAPSIGTHFANHIRGKYASTRLD